MDYPLQRQKFCEQLADLFDNLVINDNLIQSLTTSFSVSMEAIKNVPDELKKAFILLELTKNRYSCNQVIKLLRDSDDEKNQSLARKLATINTSPGPQDYTDDIEITVTPTESADVRGKGESQVYPMTQMPRGKAIIINNVQNIVKRESQRFEYIFKQLLFEVEMAFDLTADEIKERLNQTKDDINREFDEKEFIPQALIVMVISHGCDERVFGKNACNVTEPNDQVNIRDIVDIFSEENIEFEDPNFIKMFFFTCCRIVTDIRFSNNSPCTLQWSIDNNNDTLVFNSCAEGYSTFIEPNNYYTQFGKCLSESIAQYAHKEPLTQIMNRTCGALRKKWGREGHFAPEFRAIALTSSVFFNPHWFDESEQ